MVSKINEMKLAPDLIAGIIRDIEEKPVENTDWIESVTADKSNTWTLWIKPKAFYYPESILKYNKQFKSRLIKGKLYQIEEILSKAYNKH